MRVIGVERVAPEAIVQALTADAQKNRRKAASVRRACRGKVLGSPLVDGGAPMQPRVPSFARSGDRGLAVSKSEGSARLSGGICLVSWRNFPGRWRSLGLNFLGWKKKENVMPMDFLRRIEKGSRSP